MWRRRNHPIGLDLNGRPSTDKEIRHRLPYTGSMCDRYPTGPPGGASPSTSARANDLLQLFALATIARVN